MKKGKSVAHSAEMKNANGDWHVSHTNMGMGDYYGTGIRAKLGRVRDGIGVNPTPPHKLKTPPKSLG